MAKVLLVEDDNNLREIYEARMQAEGYDVCTAADGEQALVVAKEQKPDLVISDVMMPKISGFEMLDILRNTDGLKDIKVIMLTALGQTDDQARADRLGADRYLVKSQVTLEDIVNVAHQLLNDLPEPAPAEPIADTPAPVVPIEPLAMPPAPVAEPIIEIPAPVASEVAPVVATTPIAPVVVEPVSPPPVVEPSVVATAPPAIPVVAIEPAPVTPIVEPPALLAVEPLGTLPQTTFAAVQVEPSTNPVSEQVAAQPITEPSVATTITTPLPVSTVPNAQSSAQEEADVEAQIENFVAGATSEAPATDSTPAPVVVATDAQKSADAATDDKIMADAVESLIASTPASNEASATPASEPVVIPDVPSAPNTTTETETFVATPPAESSAATPQPVAPVSMIAGKKIISPLSNGEAKPDINDLLAKEEAKDILSQAPQPPVTTPAPAVTSNDTKIDPNSIAL